MALPLDGPTLLAMGAHTEHLLDMHEMLRTGEARRLRERLGLSMTDIARDLEVTEPAVSRWEAGLRRPQGANAIRYAKLLRKLAERESSRLTRPRP